MKQLLSKIGLFFKGLFNAAARTWAKVSPEFQEALKQGSGVLAIINSNTSVTSNILIDLILKAYPELTRETLFAGLKGVEKGLNIADRIAEDNLEATLQNLQTFLAEVKIENSSFWAGTASFGAKLLALAFAPKNTKWATLEALMEFVYHQFIKPQFDKK